MNSKLIVAVVIGTVALLGIHTAYANWGAQGPGNCWRNRDVAAAPVDEATQKKNDEFYQSTKDLRKAMAAKQSERQALMQGDNPDPAKAALLTNEIFDLRDSLQAKAREAGVQTGFGRGCAGGNDRAGCAGAGFAAGNGRAGCAGAGFAAGNGKRGGCGCQVNRGVQ